jgi:hypothetical protein
MVRTFGATAPARRYARDLPGGFFIRTAVPAHRGPARSPSDVPGEAPGRTVVAEALVVRMGADADRGLGCRFFRITAGSLGHLEECLQLLEEQKSQN